MTGARPSPGAATSSCRTTIDSHKRTQNDFSTEDNEVNKVSAFPLSALHFSRPQVFDCPQRAYLLQFPFQIT